MCRPPKGGAFDEQSPPHPDIVTRSAWDGENLAREAGARHRYAAAVLRCGFFYGSECWHTRLLAESLQRRRLPLVGPPSPRWSCLHTIDAATAFVATAELGRAGLWHVVDDEPAGVHDFLNCLAAGIGAPRPRHVPVWLARLLAGAAAVDFFTTTTVTSNRKFCAEVGWRPQYPTYRQGLAQVIAQWRASGSGG